MRKPLRPKQLSAKTMTAKMTALDSMRSIKIGMKLWKGNVIKNKLYNQLCSVYYSLYLDQSASLSSDDSSYIESAEVSRFSAFG